MNALANDQVERLRSLLADCPEITYGSYTGQTKERYSDALTEYLQLNEGQTPHPNELISREQMKSTPPHILITNYTDLDEKNFTSFKRLKHKNSAGYPCPTGSLKRFSLGYRFETDVLQLRFINPDQMDWEATLSLLYGIMRGICSYLNIEQDDISGCVQYFYNDVTHRPNYALVFYDRTPGGAGHVRRLGDPVTLEAVLRTTLRLMEACTCGGTSRDTSCYTCLRSYYNQKYHDILNRGVVIDFIKNVLK